MPVVYKRPRSIAAIWSKRIGFLTLISLIAAWGLHRFANFPTPDAIGLGLVISLVAAFGLGLSVIGLSMLWVNGSRGGKASFVGLCLNLIALLPFGLASYRYVTLPQQFDVSTSEQELLYWLEEPERPVSWLPEGNDEEILLNLGQSKIYSQLSERRYQGAIDRVYQAVQAIIRNEKLSLVSSTGNEYLSPIEPEIDSEITEQASDKAPVPTPAPPVRLENAEEQVQFEGTTIRIQLKQSSFILGIEHDVMLLLTEDESATFVDMRAATKYGPHDLGLNAALINRFLTKVDNNLLGIVGSN